MHISLVSLSLVAHDAPHRTPHLDCDVEARVQAFFVGHIEALRKMSQGRDAPPPGHFGDVEAQALFQALHNGSADEFLDTAGILAKRLIGRMNGRTTKGLLACVRAEGNSGRISAVLKLEVDPSNGTRLEELASGEIRLASVTNVLEQPGDLQKGILVTNELPAEDVLCSDTLTHQARYFPEAFGINVFAPPSRGPVELLKAVEQYDHRLMPPVASALRGLEPGTLAQVVTDLSDRLPEMTEEARSSIVGRLEHLPRPVAYLDTSKQVTMVIEQDDIIIRGPADAILDHVRVRPSPDSGWEAVIRFSGEPKTTYR